MTRRVIYVLRVIASTVLRGVADRCDPDIRVGGAR